DPGTTLIVEPLRVMVTLPVPFTLREPPFQLVAPDPVMFTRVPEATSMVPPPGLMVIGRLVSKPAETTRFPPPSVIEPVDAPRFESDETRSVPPLMVVPPL